MSDAIFTESRRFDPPFGQVSGKILDKCIILHWAIIMLNQNLVGTSGELNISIASKILCALWNHFDTADLKTGRI